MLFRSSLSRVGHKILLVQLVLGAVTMRAYFISPNVHEFPTRYRRQGVSLVEVMIVIAVVVLLLAMLLPSLSGARETARRLMCKSNLRQWGTAFQYYQQTYDDYIPTEGTFFSVNKPGTWFNELPPFLGLPSYKDVERIDKQIKEFPRLHVWICPSKSLTDAYKSGSGKNQFHYGMNQVLDGLGSAPDGSKDTPGFPDLGEAPLRARQFLKKPNTVLMFDIAGNSPAGTQRSVATEHWRGYYGEKHKFHGDYANILYLSGEVGNCETDDIVADRNNRFGEMIWTNPRFYWGYLPPTE